MTCTKIFTITCRGGKAFLFSNVPNAQGKRSYKKFFGEDSMMAAINAWVHVLKVIPDDYEEPVAILLPSCVSFLAFDDTRNFWLENQCTKAGEVISDEMMEWVETLDELLNQKKDKTHNISHKYVKAYKYKAEISWAWNITNKLCPREYSLTNDDMSEVF